MFDSTLQKYQNKGSFNIKLGGNFKEACYAPDTKSGIYVFYKVEPGKETVLYIGSSGRRGKDGLLKHRIGGMKDRLVNGYHPNRFGNAKRTKRHIAIPEQMRKEKIVAIKIAWFVTYQDDHKDFPTDVEKQLVEEYRLKFGSKPPWHA